MSCRWMWSSMPFSLVKASSTMPLPSCCLRECPLVLFTIGTCVTCQQLGGASGPCPCKIGTMGVCESILSVPKSCGDILMHVLIAYRCLGLQTVLTTSPCVRDGFVLLLWSVDPPTGKFLYPSETGEAPNLLFSHKIPLKPLADGFAPTCIASHLQTPLIFRQK